MLFLSCSCGPASGAFWYGLFLIGGLLLLLTAFLLVLIPILRRGSNTTDKRGFNSRWYSDYIGLFIIAICFYITWGFGLPALRPLYLGALRLVFQIIFLLGNIILGIVMIVVYCLLSEQVRAIVVKPVYTMDEQHADDNIYTMTMNEKNEELYFQNLDDISLLPPAYSDVELEDIGPESKEDLVQTLTSNAVDIEL